MNWLKSFQKRVYASRELSVTVTGVLAYIASVCTIPSSGILSSLPLMFAASWAASWLCGLRVVIYAMMTAMPLLLNLLYGFDVSHAIFAAVYGLVTAVLAVLSKRALYTAKVSRKNKKSGIYVKSIAVLCVSVVLGAAVWLFCFGNPVSALVAKSENKEYVQQKYADTVKCGYTYYDAFERAYLTEIFFDGEENGETYYVSAGKKDDYYSFCENKLYAEACDYFERQTTIDADTVGCYIDGSGLVLTPQSDYRSYLDKYEYLLNIPEVVTDVQSFKQVYENISDFIELSDTFKYKSITVLANDTDGDSYFAYKEFERPTEFIWDNPDFELIVSEKFGK